MALADLMELSLNAHTKKVGLSEERIKAQKELLRKYKDVIIINNTIKITNLLLISIFTIFRIILIPNIIIIITATKKTSGDNLGV